ncbi:hypothetical protein [Streptomyces sp. NPDC058457]
MVDKTVIITGGNASLGYQYAKNLALSDPGCYMVLQVLAGCGFRTSARG